MISILYIPFVRVPLGRTKVRSDQSGTQTCDWLILLRLLRCERSHIYREAVLHIGLEQSLVSFVDLLDGDHFHICGDVMWTAKIEHFLGLGDASDGRAGETA